MDTYFNLFSEWKKSQPILLKWWNDINHFWLNDFKGSVLPVLYSRLLTDLDGELRRMLNFLEWHYNDRDIQCTIENREGHFHRKPRKWTKIKSIVELFTPDMQTQINSSYKIISEQLKNKYSLEGLWYKLNRRRRKQPSHDILGLYSVLFIHWHNVTLLQ